MLVAQLDGMVVDFLNRKNIKQIKTMKWIKYYWNWWSYKNATMNERIEYLQAQLEGSRVSNFEQGMLIHSHEVHPNEPPQERSFLNWEEYKERWHPINGTFIK
jgi:hypothetical protein